MSVDAMPALVRVLLGITLIVLGGMYPMWAVYRLNRRLGRPDGPTLGELVWWLVFTLSFPFALALSGVGLIATQLAASPVFWAVVLGLVGVALVGGLGYLYTTRRENPS